MLDTFQIFISDKRLTDISGVLRTLQAGDGLMADRGFDIHCQGECAAVNVVLTYTAKDICVERILFDNEFWSGVEAKLADFYANCVLPAIVHHKGVNAVAALMVE